MYPATVGEVSKKCVSKKVVRKQLGLFRCINVGSTADDNHMNSGGAVLSSAHRQRLEQALLYIQQNCTKHILLEDVARTAGLSSFHFHRTFRAYFGKTVKEAISECQIELAKQLLLQGMSATDVAVRVGFCNQSHLTQRFKRMTGLPPIFWLRRQKSAASSSFVAEDGASRTSAA